MKIIVDVMSGDFAPKEILRGAAQAAREYPVTVCAVGDESVIRETAKAENIDISSLSILPADGVISMEDAPLSVVREKRGSSMAVGLRALAEGTGDAFVSAGNTGALLAGATLIVRRIRGIERAGIATVLPLANPVLLLDSGANLQITPENAEQFARMGAVYMNKIYGIEAPRIALLNNGTEPTKGLPFQKETYERLKAAEDLHFVGNAEGKDVPFGCCDVLIADGFTGNIFLKTVEGMSRFVLSNVKELFYKNLITKLGGSMVKPYMAAMKKKFDASEHGGAPILGISKPVIKAHGSSDAKAVQNAVRQAMQFVSSGINWEIAHSVNAWDEEGKNGKESTKNTDKKE